MKRVVLVLALIFAGIQTLAAGENQGDRKSTRLNSSHVRISYAAFCLKKKKDPRAWIFYAHGLNRAQPANYDLASPVHLIISSDYNQRLLARLVPRTYYCRTSHPRTPH